MSRHTRPGYWCESCGEVPPRSDSLRTVRVEFFRTYLHICYDCWDDVLACCYGDMQVGTVLEALLDQAFIAPRSYSPTPPMARAGSVRMH